MRFYIVLLTIFLFSATTYGQSVSSRPTPTPEPVVSTAAPTPEPERVLNKALKTQIFEIKHRDPASLAKVLRGLSSDDRGTQLTPDKDFKTITVRDHQENISVMERAVMRLDVPEKLPANLKFQLHIIAASRTGKDKEQIPKNLEDVIVELQKTLQYSSYRYVTSIFGRVQDGKDLEGNGSTDPIFPVPEHLGEAAYNYVLRDIKLGIDSNGGEIVQINRLAFQVKSPLVIGKKSDGTSLVSFKEASISTSLSLRDSEKVVVGTANIGKSEDAVILVVSVEKIK